MEQDFEVTMDASPDALFREWPRAAPSIVTYVQRIHPQYKETLSLVDGCSNASNAEENNYGDEVEFSQCKFSSHFRSSARETSHHVTCTYQSTCSQSFVVSKSCIEILTSPQEIPSNIKSKVDFVYALHTQNQLCFI